MINSKYIKINYYKCSVCGCRVGIPVSETARNTTIGNPTCKRLYCNICNDDTIHIYCGYKTVIR